MTQLALQVEDLHVRYGDAVAVDGVSLDVPARRLTVLLGANGAGKSSLLQAVSGLVPHRGTVRVAGRALDGLSPESRARVVTHVPEGRHLFGGLTVAQNLVLGAFTARRAERERRLQACFEVFPGLADLAGRPAGELSGGQQQMVALGRGLMAGTGLICVDELSLGLAPIVATGFVAALARLVADGRSVLLVEQSAALVLPVADHVVVMRHGRVVAAGRPEAVADHVEEAYLGTREGQARAARSRR